MNLPLPLKKGILALIATALFLGSLEGFLRLIRFESPLPPLVIRTGKTDDGGDVTMAHDPDLLWFYRPGDEVHGQPINRLGFPEREVERDKAPNTVRVICMGDSCTAGGVPPYSTLLHGRFTAQSPDGRRWEAFHNAVHGYSSVQGLALFRKITIDLQPDIITLYFGWNDHWLSKYPDSIKLYSEQATRLDHIRNAFQEVRIYQLLARLIHPVTLEQEEGSRSAFRVPPAEFATILGSFVNEARERKMLPVLITAPRANRVHRAVEKAGHATSREEALRLHDEYADIVRTVARDTGTPLVDLAAHFAALPGRNDYFTRDGIHLKRKGRDVVAELLYKNLANLFPEPIFSQQGKPSPPYLKQNFEPPLRTRPTVPPGAAPAAPASFLPSPPDAS